MRALVTGASGMLGLNLVEELLEWGHEIVAVVNRGSLERRPWAREVLSDAEVVESRVEDLDRGFEVDAVFHLAFRLSGRGAYKSNVGSTENLLRRVKTDAFVFASAILALGDALKVGASEDLECRPKTTYERAKCESERLVLSSGVTQPIVVRPAWIYGPYSRNLDLIMLAKWLKRGVRLHIGGRDLPVGMVHAKDVARAMVHLVTSGARGIFNIRGPRMYSMGEVMDIMSGHFGRKGIGLTVPRSVVGLATPIMPVARYITLAPEEIPIERLEEMGFRPSIDLELGLPEALAWMQENGLI